MNWNRATAIYRFSSSLMRFLRVRITASGALAVNHIFRLWPAGKPRSYGKCPEFVSIFDLNLGSPHGMRNEIEGSTRAPVKKSHLGQFDQKSWNLLALAAHVACQDKKNSGGTGVLPMRETLHRLVLRPQQENPQWLVFSSGLFAEMSSATPARIRSSPNVKANSGLETL